MKTSSNRLKEEMHNFGQLTIAAFVLSLVFSPVGLLLYFFAKDKEGENQMLKWTLVFAIIGTAIWAFSIVSWAVWYSWYIFILIP